MRISFVLAGLGAGGAEKVVALVSAHWVARGHRVSVIAFDAADAPTYHGLDPAVRVVRLALPPDRGGGALRILRRVGRLRRELRRDRPDFVIAFLFKVNIITLLAARGLGIPVAVAERNHPGLQAAHRLWSRLRRWTYPWASRLILQTEASRAALPPALRGQGVVIPNPIDRHARTPEADGPKILAAVGRLDRQKGFDLLLQGFALVEQRHPDWTLVIWGEGPERSALEAERDRLGLATRVVMPGLSAGSADWIGRAAAFVLSSRFEGFPNALAEAMAAGLPVVAFDCEFGVGTMLSHEHSGVLVPLGDVGALADALHRLMSDKPLRDRLSQRALEQSRLFSAPLVLKRWDRLLTLSGPDAAPANEGRTP
jgi:glycosyltransferase involved in cell wall biosynthesis